MKRLSSLIIVLAILPWIIGPGLIGKSANSIFRDRMQLPVRDAAISQVNGIAQVNPSSCPSAGCAAGQRINFLASFGVATSFSGSANVHACFYSSNAGNSTWIDKASFSTTSAGWTSDPSGSICSTTVPTNYDFLGGANANLSAGPNSLNFAFRINKDSAVTSVDNPISITIYETNDGSKWTATSTLTLSKLSISSPRSPAYVANDASTCGSNAPCFVNSADDLEGGLGTGLKDAIDSLPPASTINILGSYNIKGSPVNISQSDIIQGIDNASITTSVCSNNPLLQVSAGATIRQLNVSAGSCSSTRDLIAVASPDQVTIESDDLNGGKNAISLTGNNGSVQVRFNQIQGNKGYGIIKSGGNGSIQATANNIYGNQGSKQVDCKGSGNVDHNFWGTGLSVSGAVANCTASDGKRLGTAIVQNNSTPGVDARRVTVTSSRTTYPSLGIAFNHDSGGDFDIYIVNYGNGSNSNIPFLNIGTDAINPCGNFLDIFLAQNAGAGSLNLFFRYDLNQACVTTVESQNFCGQSDPSKFPLWWYDPQGNVTDKWDTTGQNPAGTGANGASGQTTSCLTNNHEIEVSFSSNGRPGLSQDLNFTPFIAGYYPVGFLSFKTKVNVSQSTIQWETLYESGISAFYIIRSLQPDGIYNRVIGPISNKGNETIGGIYAEIDETLDFGKTYYYKLEIIGQDGSTIGYYGPVAAITATATPTVTNTPTITMTFTRTLTGTVTLTRTPTKTRTLFVYRSNTASRLRTSTNTPFRTSTMSKSNTPFPSSTISNGTPSVTPSPSLAATPSQGSNGYPGQTTQIAYLTGTTIPTGDYPSSQGTTSVTPTGDTTQAGNKAAFWVSLATGGVLGIIVLGIAVWYLIQRRIIQ